MTEYRGLDEEEDGLSRDAKPFLKLVLQSGQRIHRSTTENFCWDEIRPRDWLNVDVGIFGHASSIILSKQQQLDTCAQRYVPAHRPYQF